MGIIVTTHRPPRSTALQTRKESFRHPERWPRSLSSGERAGLRASVVRSRSPDALRDTLRPELAVEESLGLPYEQARNPSSSGSSP